MDQATVDNATNQSYYYIQTVYETPKIQTSLKV